MDRIFLREHVAVEGGGAVSTGLPALGAHFPTSTASLIYGYVCRLNGLRGGKQSQLDNLSELSPH